MWQPKNIEPAGGKLGVLFVGMGAVATTAIAGVLPTQRGLAKPIGFLAQTGPLRRGKRTPRIKELDALALSPLLHERTSR